MVGAELSTNIARRKINEVIDTGAEAVISACRQCVRTMTTFTKRNKVPTEVMDITMLVKKTLYDNKNPNRKTGWRNDDVNTAKELNKRLYRWAIPIDVLNPLYKEEEYDQSAF